MPNYCAVYGCSSSTKSDVNRRYFHFPIDERRCEKWVQACDRRDFAKKTTAVLHKNHLVCDLHFKSDDFMMKKLKQYVIPTQNLPIKPSVSTQTEESIGKEQKPKIEVATQTEEINIEVVIPAEEIKIEEVTEMEETEVITNHTQFNFVKSNLTQTTQDFSASTPRKRKQKSSVSKQSNNESSNSKKILIEVPSISPDWKDQSYKEVVCKVEAIYDEDPLEESDGLTTENIDTNSLQINDTLKKPEHSIDGFLAGIRPILQNLGPCELGSAKMAIIDAMYKYRKTSKEPTAKKPSIRTEEEPTAYSEIQIKIEPADVDYSMDEIIPMD